MTTVAPMPIDQTIPQERAEAAETVWCNCPDDCERDHEND
jgi:hypothetical protein